MAEAHHTIKATARRTGLTPHVLRVWEKRYGALLLFVGAGLGFFAAPWLGFVLAASGVFVTATQVLLFRVEHFWPAVGD